jgi:signal transduction histidine kinase
LQAITGDVYLLRDYLSGMPDTISVKHDVAQSLEEIEKNVGYINKIVADLQDYSRAVTPELRNLNLYELVTGAFRNIEIPENVNPTIEIDSKINLKTDATLLTRILTNLVINAIQAMPKGGKLSIVAMQTQDSLVLSVQDTGVGIPEYIKPKLFTPMTTTKAKGQGLGLAVVKRLVEALKGTICFESKEGNGTKFTITLPINR